MTKKEDVLVQTISSTKHFEKQVSKARSRDDKDRSRNINKDKKQMED